jgi:1,4-alpha-glucan branching enzyme
MDDRSGSTTGSTSSGGTDGLLGGLTSRDLEGFHAGTDTHCWRILGAHLVTIPDQVRGGAHGTRFAVWAPNARAVRVKGDFDGWTGVPLSPVPGTGVWALFVEGVGDGVRYRFDVLGADGIWREKVDPMARRTESAPSNTSVVHESSHDWRDAEWMARRADSPRLHQAPMAIYEVHLASWRPGLTYRELADELVAYVTAMGYTHVEFMPITEHPLLASWGYQVTNYFAPQARLGAPDDLRLLIDALRVDAVASMVYLDYGREHGQWAPNELGGNHYLEAIDFLRQLNGEVQAQVPGALMVAEESTAFDGVTRSLSDGGLGFSFKWNMGWMNDTLRYLALDPFHRQYDHHDMTFAMLYQYTEHYILPISHDEVVHGKGSMVNKIPQDAWRQFATLRAYYGFMWAFPGKKLLFMGCDFGQRSEWSEERSLEWWVTDLWGHQGLQRLVADLNALYRAHPALWRLDSDPAGFSWINNHDAGANTFSWLRMDGGGEQVACVINFSPQPWTQHRIGLPEVGPWRQILNTDDARYDGSGSFGQRAPVIATADPWDDLPASATIVVPPMAAVMYRYEGGD